MDRFTTAVVVIGTIGILAISAYAEESRVQRHELSAVFTGEVLGAGQIPVKDATVHLVPVDAIDMTPITASDVWREPYIAQAYDEPLEDAIRASGDKFPSGKSGMEGRFAISDIPDGKYYIHVTPAPGDVTHLPGGDKSRESYDAEELRNGMMKIAISSRPSAEAHYVGSTACLECHD
ncbi:MAG: hypothetical protein MI754_04060, partial [Chromatiales bacterium]|nr:hypothetical protein [Chromatiales bacterium]